MGIHNLAELKSVAVDLFVFLNIISGEIYQYG